MQYPDFTNYLKVVSMSQLPRNDNYASYAEVAVAGSWALSGNNATFTPSGNIAANTRYEVRVSQFMVNTIGTMLGEDYCWYFTGQYTPFYVSPRALKARFRSESLTLPDDLLNYHIYMASLEANTRYWGYLQQAMYPVGDSLLETIVRDNPNLKSHGVLKWVEACATYHLLRSILLDETRNIGRDRSLSGYRESLSRDFVEGMKLSLDIAKQEMDEYANYLIPSDMARIVNPHSEWSDRYSGADMILRHVEAGRNNWFTGGRF
jgi:hypothetical protein